jgi:hypothetical protein
MPSKVTSVLFRASDLMLSSGAATRPSQVMVPMYSDLTRQDMSIPFGQKSAGQLPNVQPGRSSLLMIKQ